MTTVTISRLSHDGRGIGHINGKTIFVSGAMVGETVLVTTQRRKASYDEATVDTILIPSPHRVEPKCLAFGTCGGCSLQYMDGQAQIKHKEAVLIEQLLHVGKIMPKKMLPPVMADNYGYRRKARLGVRYVIKKEKLLIGFREKNGRYLAEIEACPVLHQSIGKNLTKLRNFLLQLEGYLQIPQLEIAVGDVNTAIILRHLKPISQNDLDSIKQFARTENFHLYLQPGGPDSAYLVYPENEKARLCYQLDEFGLTLYFHPTDFVQINQDINTQLVRLAIELLAPRQDETMLDLFCGIGNFTLPIATRCQQVLGIEGTEAMVARGNENAKLNAITNAEFQCHDLSDKQKKFNWVERKFDGVLLDPPRTGALEVIEKLSTSEVKRIVYISCNPATLARDALQLTQQGYELAAAGVLDMFPHTSHVESIALFKRE